MEVGTGGGGEGLVVMLAKGTAEKVVMPDKGAIEKVGGLCVVGGGMALVGMLDNGAAEKVGWLCVGA